MRASLTVLAMSAIVATLGVVPACKTDEPGVKSTYRSQYTTMVGNTGKVTEAAEEVLKDMKLQRVTSKSTEVDGLATGYTADGKKITVEIERDSDTTSEVRVNVGQMGDPDLGKTIISRMEQKLG